MGNYENLKQSITEVIRTNGNQEITGAVLQSTLLTIISTVGANATFAGIATPTTNPGTPDGSVFWLASESGTYSNFGGIELQDGLSVLMWNGSWNSQQIFSVDDEPTANSDNLVKSGGVQEELALGAVYDVSAKNPTAGTNNDGKFESLSALLEDANLDTLIPISVRKGGMSIKFVQSSDNNYVQFRCKTQSFSANPEDWYFEGDDTLVENPEYLRAVTDGAGHLLGWIRKSDGGIDWAVGVPKPVKDYVDIEIAKIVNGSVSTDIDGINKIIVFLDDFSTSDTLAELLATKVDKEEGKSLIPTQYIQEVENPEYIEVKTDAEDKILEATEKDGTKLFGDDVKVLGSIDVSGASYKVVTNPEWLKVVLDADDRIICGIKTDGKFVVYVADFLDDIEVIKTRLKELDAYSVAENPEFMEVELDADDKVLGGRKVDGTKFENNDVELNGNATVGGSLEVDGTVIKNIEDPEGRLEIATDSKDKIISYRKDDGTKVENVGIETPKVSTNSLELTEQGMTEFQQALKDAGFQPGGAGDWSDYISNDGKNPLQLPIPQIAKINYICAIDSLSNLSKSDRPDGQEGVNYDVPSYVEYWDTLGNYFKKPSKISGQGNSTMNDPMRSIAMDLFDSDDFDNAFAIKFGDWVAQDSFHVKAYYKDVTKGVSTISYKIGEVITKFLDARANRLSKNIFNISAAGGSGKAEYDYSTNALCHPDGFPVEVYHNGNYYGLSVLSLKKHRMNYSMDKNDYTSVLIDNIGSFKWNNGTLNWSSTEFRNPKTLYCMDGTKYDGDNPKEIIDSTSQYYDSTNKNHVKSAEMKALVLSFLTAYGDIRNEQNVATRKNMWRQHFDIENTIAYIIFSNLTYNQDGWMNNAQISIYNNKMGFNIYDCDSCLGKSWNGTIWSCSAKGIVIGPSIHHGHILFYIANDFKDEIKAAYQALRDSKVIDVNNLSQFMIDWSNRIGYEAYKKSIDTWTNSPSYSLGNLNSEYWRQIVIGTEDLPSEYDDTVPYNKGDKCRIGSDLSYNTCIFECVKNTEPGQSPLTSGSLPTGCYDSPYRYKKWFTLRINVLDTYYNYNN